MKKAAAIFQNRIFRGILVALFWLALWQFAAVLVGQPILFASPLQTVNALAALVPTTDFWQAVGQSLLRIAGGFFLAFFTGILTGAAAWRWRLLRSLLSPLLTFFKSVPVASFIVLALVWFGSKSLAIAVSAIIVFPLIYFAMLNGLDSTDKKLLEMAQVFRLSAGKRIWEIYRPAVLPYLTAACSSALGMSWKAGIAAEVIGTPLHSIGEQLYLSKLYLNTADLFAWTAVVIFLSLGFEKLVLFGLKRAGGRNGHSV